MKERKRSSILATRGFQTKKVKVAVPPKKGSASPIKYKNEEWKTSTPEPLPAGRYGGGLKPEDVDYLVRLHEHRKDNGDLNANGMSNITDLMILTLMQLAGMPARKYVDSIVNDKAANRLNRMFNEYQEEWKFVWQARAAGGSDSRVMDFKVEDITMIGGQEFADLMEI